MSAGMDVNAIADAVVERLDNRGLPRYLSVKHAAECLDVSEDFMRRNAGRFADP